MSFVLYEINTRCWLRELTDRLGHPVTLETVPESEFHEWQRLGFTHVWLMGVWTSGPKSRAAALAVGDLQKTYGSDQHRVSADDIVASPYSIASWTVPEALGGELGLRVFRERLNRIGIRLILDFVPNHLGLDHPWLQNRPQLFVQSDSEREGAFSQATEMGVRWIAHGRDPYFPPWTDTAQLDYRLIETREAMLGELLRIAERCDGIRCDMAMLLLQDVFAKTWSDWPSAGKTIASGEEEFWSKAIRGVKERHPDFLFVGEVYWNLEARLQTLGFDFTYNKELYDEIVRRDVGAIGRRLSNAKPGFLARSLHFLENHDEPRIASLLAEPEHRTTAVLLLSLPGMCLLHDGQLSGAKFKSAVQLGRRPVEPVQTSIRNFYERLLAVTTRLPTDPKQFQMLQSGPGDGPLLLLWRIDASSFWLIAVNLHTRPIEMEWAPNVEMNRAAILVSDKFQAADVPVEIVCKPTSFHLNLPPLAAGIFRIAIR